MTNSKRNPATFVLVHGAWSGGWCYGKVAALLRARGHAVFTPTLTGQGERSHLLAAGVNLTTHITDVLNVFHYEDLRDVVLAGHSYGGMVVTGVADRIADRVAALVYLDAFLPEDGQSLFDINIPANTQRFVANAGNCGGIAVPPPPASFFNVNAADAARVDALATPFPLAAMAERLSLTGVHKTCPQARLRARDRAAAREPVQAVLRPREGRSGLDRARARLRPSYDAGFAGEDGGDPRSGCLTAAVFRATAGTRKRRPRCRERRSIVQAAITGTASSR